MSRVVYSLSGDTFDDIAYRYYTGDSVAMLPQLLAANPGFSAAVILPINSAITIPDQPTSAVQRQALNLWD